MNKNPRICPFLGLVEDAKTALGYPSDWNCCHHCKPISAIALDHQRRFCMGRDHKNCLAFNQPANTALPRDLRGRQPAGVPAGKRVWKITLALALIGLLVVLIPFFSAQMRSFSPPGSMNLLTQPSEIFPSQPGYVTVSPALTLSAGAILVSGATSPATQPTSFLVEPTTTTLPPAEATATLTRMPHQIEELIGINPVFRIHRVKQGENLDLLAYRNDTTVAAIMAVNYQFSAPVHVKQVLIIPFNQTDVSALPAFEAYYVPEEISVQALGLALGADPAQIQLYNNLGTSTQLQSGEWILVPRPAGEGE